MSEFIVKIFFKEIITTRASFCTLFTSGVVASVSVLFMLVLNEYFRSYKQIIKFKHNFNFHFFKGKLT